MSLVRYTVLATSLFAGASLFGCAATSDSSTNTNVEHRSFNLVEDWRPWLLEGLPQDRSVLAADSSPEACMVRLHAQCSEAAGALGAPQRVALFHESSTNDSSVLCASACSTTELSTLKSALRSTSTDRGIRGWNVLDSSYEGLNLLDGLSLEWDYFMVHDDQGRFTGSVGYLLSDPRGRLGGRAQGSLWPNIVPSGMNAAIAGSFGAEQAVAEFKGFGLANGAYSAALKTTDAVDPQGGDTFAKMDVKKLADGQPALQLSGRTDNFEWDLEVSQDWAHRGGFEPVTGKDVGLIPGEHWTVEMLWPRTRVIGSITNRTTGKVTPIDGHGYRENSWGRWAFAEGGWDFGVASDDTSKVQWAWQSYHHRSTKLDFLDLSFVDKGELKKERFISGPESLGWTHPTWTFDRNTRQCVPLTSRVVAANDRYVVEADLDIGKNQVPMLSNVTTLTKIFFIQIQFPFVRGTIKNRATGKVVASFAAQGGGEFANLRSVLPNASDSACGIWGKKFSSKLPSAR